MTIDADRDDEAAFSMRVVADWCDVSVESEIPTASGGIPDQARQPRPHRAGQGMLMERYEIDAHEAFGLLAKLSQESNTKLAEIARRIIDAGPE